MTQLDRTFPSTSSIHQASGVLAHQLFFDLISFSSLFHVKIILSPRTVSEPSSRSSFQLEGHL